MNDKQEKLEKVAGSARLVRDQALVVGCKDSVLAHLVKELNSALDELNSPPEKTSFIPKGSSFTLSVYVEDQPISVRDLSNAVWQTMMEDLQR